MDNNLQTQQKKLDLIEWIASMDRQDWVETVWILKQSLQLDASQKSANEEKIALRGYGDFEGQVWISDDFNEPLEAFDRVTK